MLPQALDGLDLRSGIEVFVFDAAETCCDPRRGWALETVMLPKETNSC